MSSAVYFIQGCPTCGRRLQIRVEHLGRFVVCQHCRGQFVACDPASNRYGSYDSALIDRADELLKRAAQDSTPPRYPYPR
jgi:hypothetical protein